MIYIDVLIAVNLYINYFLIRGTAVLLRRDISSRRCILSSALGSLFSLIILVPELPFILSALFKVGSSFVLVIIAFGKVKSAELIINTLCFLVVSFVYAGLMLALWVFFAPFGMFYRNGTVYFDIPIIAIALLTAISYGIIRFLRYISDKRNLSTMTCEVTIIMNGHDVIRLHGIADTGNSLCDPFSGKPAVICSAKDIDTIIPNNIKLYLQGDISSIEGLRLAPCSTIAGDLLIPIFFPDKLVINNKSVDAVVGVCTRPIAAQCIFNPKLISL